MLIGGEKRFVALQDDAADRAELAQLIPRGVVVVCRRRISLFSSFPMCVLASHVHW
eukprot:COSAG06_NODE_995_length_11158_cov_10.796184_4_plen_56_part_00